MCVMEGFRCPLPSPEFGLKEDMVLVKVLANPPSRVWDSTRVGETLSDSTRVTEVSFGRRTSEVDR